MPEKLSPTATSLLILLNNIRDLVAQSNNRQGAKDVMSALKIYARNKNFPCPEDKIDDFYAVLLDSRPNTISFLLHDIAQDIITADKKRHKFSN